MLKILDMYPKILDKLVRFTICLSRVYGPMLRISTLALAQRLSVWYNFVGVCGGVPEGVLGGVGGQVDRSPRERVTIGRVELLRSVLRASRSFPQ